MSVLFPLFLAGLGALSLPLIFHLVRRTPRSRQDFSSLMFLVPSPPRLTRRSRLDQILLLLLRLGALALLVAAFARPFLREGASLSFADLGGRRVALLIDNSASMRRGNLWKQALDKAEKELAELNPQDDVALYAFSDRLRTIVDFERENSTPVPSKVDLVRLKLKELRPEWGSTDLGTALVAVAGEMDSTTDPRQAALDPQIVAISDFQKGSRLEALQAFEWPKRIPVVTRTVVQEKGANAFAHVLVSDEDEPDAGEVRVRVVNAADSAGDQFYLTWAGDTVKIDKSEEVSIYVPPGQSRVVRLPRRGAALQADRILLRGDDFDFDNSYFVVPPRKLAAVVLYVGSDAADDAQGLQFYLRLAVADDPLREVDVRASTALQPQDLLGEPGPRLVVISAPVEEAKRTALASYVQRGGTVLYAPVDAEGARAMAALFEDVEQPAAKETKDGDFLLLGEIDFAHPLFAPLAGPRYNDFTKIHFWKHWPLALKTPATTRALARFDNGEPALLERLAGKGRILALASSWKPTDSQFALSGKFVAFVGALIDQACGAEIAANAFVHQPVALPSGSTETAFVVETPDGRRIDVPAREKSFTETDRPGIYRAKGGLVEARFAVNLPAAESNTAPLDLEQLEQQGVRFGGQLTRAERIDRERQQRDTELEGRQKLWRWLLVGAIGILIFETWWAGRAERIITSTAGSVP